MDELTKEECEAYQVLCGLAAHVLRGSLSDDGLARLVELAPQLREEPFLRVNAQAAATMADALGGAAGAFDALYHALRQDYAFLFYSVPLSGCSPYESVYRTPDRTMFGPTTFEVRAAYRARGLELATGEHEPDDHVALEFEFAAALLAQAAQGDAGAQEALRAFLSEHLLVFAPSLLARVAKQAQTPFYRAAAQLAADTLAMLAARLDARAVEAV